MNRKYHPIIENNENGEINNGRLTRCYKRLNKELNGSIQHKWKAALTRESLTAKQIKGNPNRNDKNEIINIRKPILNTEWIFNLARRLKKCLKGN